MSEILAKEETEATLWQQIKDIRKHSPEADLAFFESGGRTRILISAR